MQHLILASGSPRRALLLSAAGYQFTVEPPDVNEDHLPDESAADLVLRLAGDKARAVHAENRTVVLAADTVVVRDGDILGKPVDREHAVAILSSLQGRSHHVLTGWSVVRGDDERFGVAESGVVFSQRSVAELEDYVERMQPMDKAGAYALQGDDGWLVQKVVGSRANVMGLPLADVAVALKEFGVVRSAPNGR